MRRESHVRFCEGGGVRLPSATRLPLDVLHSQGKKRAALGAVLLFCCHPDRSGEISRREARFFCLLHAEVLPFRVDALDQGEAA